MKQRKAESGFALVAVLLVVALISLLAVTYLQRHRLMVATTGFVSLHVQLQHHIWATETWAMNVLNSESPLQASYVAPVGSFLPDEEGIVHAVLTSRDGRFNVNNLLSLGTEQNSHWQLFARLLQAQGVVDKDLQAVENYINNWRSLGYNSQKGWVRWQELFYGANVQRILRPSWNALFTAVPGVQQINVNLAPAQLLQALAAEWSAAHVERLLQQRQYKQFTDVNDFLRAAEHAGLPLTTTQTQIIATLCNTQFKFYELDLIAQMGDLDTSVKSLLQAQKKQVRILERWSGAQPENLLPDAGISYD